MRAGVWGDLGLISPHLGHSGRVTAPACQQREKRGPVPGCNGTFESILTFFLWTVQRGLGLRELPPSLRVGWQNTSIMGGRN